jgi:hypothetical protein
LFGEIDRLFGECDRLAPAAIIGWELVLFLRLLNIMVVLDGGMQFLLGNFVSWIAGERQNSFLEITLHRIRASFLNIARTRPRRACNIRLMATSLTGTNSLGQGHGSTMYRSTLFKCIDQSDIYLLRNKSPLGVTPGVLQ